MKMEIMPGSPLALNSFSLPFLSLRAAGKGDDSRDDEWEHGGWVGGLAGSPRRSGSPLPLLSLPFLRLGRGRARNHSTNVISGLNWWRADGWTPVASREGSFSSSFFFLPLPAARCAGDMERQGLRGNRTGRFSTFFSPFLFPPSGQPRPGTRIGPHEEEVGDMLALVRAHPASRAVRGPFVGPGRRRNSYETAGSGARAAVARRARFPCPAGRAKFFLLLFPFFFPSALLVHGGKCGTGYKRPAIRRAGGAVLPGMVHPPSSFLLSSFSCS